MSEEISLGNSYDIIACVPKIVNISADDLLDTTNGFYFREGIEPGQKIYRWSGARARICLPIRVDRTNGNTVSVNLMRSFCELPDIKVIVDHEDVSAVVAETEQGLVISAVIPPASKASLLLEIVSAMGPERTDPDARSLGLAFYSISISGNHMP